MNSKFLAVTAGVLAAVLAMWILSSTVGTTALPSAAALQRTYSATITDTKTGQKIMVSGTKGDIRSAFAQELGRGGIKGADRDKALAQFDAGVQRAEQAFEASQNKQVAFSSNVMPVAASYCFQILHFGICIFIY